MASSLASQICAYVYKNNGLPGRGCHIWLGSLSDLMIQGPFLAVGLLLPNTEMVGGHSSKTFPLCTERLASFFCYICVKMLLSKDYSLQGILLRGFLTLVFFTSNNFCCYMTQPCVENTRRRRKRRARAATAAAETSLVCSRYLHMLLSQPV